MNCDRTLPRKAAGVVFALTSTPFALVPISWGIDVVHLGGEDEAGHHGGTGPAAVGAREQPRLPAKDEAAQRAFGSVVAEANQATSMPLNSSHATFR